jgi:transmembrane sensor
MDDKILLRFFNDQCSPAEQAEVITWMRKAENRLLLINWLKDHWQEFDVSSKPEVNLEYIWHKIALETLPYEQENNKKAKTSRWWYGSSAAIILMALASWWWGTRMDSSKDNLLETIYRTEYGQITRIYLPDSSEVILNGNSSLTLKQAWNEDKPREVWIDGEGFFSVKHTRNHQKFIVYANENIGVEVVGTEFSVSNWREKTRVVLNNGKIHLHVKKKNTNQNIEMKPGDLAEFDHKKIQLVRQQVNPEVYSSWTEERLVFDNTPLSEVIRRIEETYGINVKMESSLYSKRLTGKVSIENLDILLEAMESSYQLKIIKTDQQITIQSR